MRSGGRVVEGARLESEYTPKAYRGFEPEPRVSAAETGARSASNPSRSIAPCPDGEARLDRPPSSACGAVAEWSKALAWKVSIRQKRIEGSSRSRAQARRRRAREARPIPPAPSRLALMARRD